MSNMIEGAGGVDTNKAKEIKAERLFGINMLIHKDGKTNLELLDSRTYEADSWITSKPINKILMNLLSSQNTVV